MVDATPRAGGSAPPARLAAVVSGRADVAALGLEATPDMGATLNRFTAAGEPAGDVWYGSAEEAQTCAARDYGAALGAWRPVPAGEPNPVAFALHAAREPDARGE